MRKLLSTLLTMFILSGVFTSVYAQLKNPVVVTGKLIRTTKPLRDFKPGEKIIPDVIVRDLDGIIGKDEALEEGVDQPIYPSSKIFIEDSALQKNYPNNSHLQNAAARAIGLNFNGMPYQPLNPPDPTLCVGPNHLIQMINGSSGALLQVYNKAGNVLKAQTYLDQITGKGGLGDPIALYDHIADRFILTEFANKPETGTEGLIFAVSQTNDPTGSWYVYFFSTGNTFPDYPKFAIWSDAYYATTNDFANASIYSGSSVYAFDKTKMLAGNTTATMQRFTMGSANKHFSMSPVGLEGNTLPPTGSGGLIAYMQDDTWTSTIDVDSIGMFEFKVDFVTPANTSVTTKSSLATTAYKSDICTASRGACISQPGTTTKVEALQQKIMNQPIYRNFGGYEGIVISHVVDKGSNISGIRWYELRKTTGNWSIYQQSTYAPDNTNRWLPGICYDRYGNIGLAYNVSSSATGVYPGARYTGRKECDALNSMTYSEDVIVAGTGSNSSSRYGDYNHLVCDPDGVTFWFTCEWNAASTWSTRIASFTLDPCVASVCGDPAGLASSAITNTTATVSWAGVSNALSYTVEYKKTSEVWGVNTAINTSSTSVNLSSLSQGITYDWRVLATCSGGNGNYVSSQFTTTAPCAAPGGLASSPSSNSATVSWNAVTGANNYDVDYKLQTASGWTNFISATASTTVNITGLTPSTAYDWQVRSHCSDGSTTANSSGQFTTTGVVTCPDAYEPNNTLGSAAAIAVNINVNAQIASGTDVDYYSFSTSGNQKNIKVTISSPVSSPYNSTLTLYSSNGSVLASSPAGTSGTVVYNTNKAGSYKILVAGASATDYNSTDCYTIKVALGNITFSANAPDESSNKSLVRGGLKLYPVPATNFVTISFDAYVKSNADIVIINQLGQQVLYKKVLVNDGINFNTIDVSLLKSGVYTLKVNNGKEIQTKKMIINK